MLHLRIVPEGCPEKMNKSLIIKSLKTKDRSKVQEEKEFKP
jgi:hypothetical protein